MLALVFLATTINYLDRIVIGFLLPEIRKEFHLSDQQYGYITSAFQISYTLGFLFMGKLIDRIGTKVGYALSIAWWSVAAALTAFSQSALQLGIWRCLLGLGEAGNFPAAIKSVAEWFPKKDRAFATGIFNAGTNVASMVGPPLFAAMAIAFGWRACFWITAASGFIWLGLWLVFYQRPDRHGRVNKEEIAYIHSDAQAPGKEPSIGWLQALGFRQTWGFAGAKFFSDPVWWFYLFWLPPYLYDVRQFDMKQVAWALPVIYLAADVGSVGGGWISGFLIRRGWPNGKARKTALAICAFCMPIAATAVLAESAVLAIALVSLATAAHQGWSANLFTTTSDIFPNNAVGSVVGIGGAVGGFGGILFSGVIPGYIVTNFGYGPMFVIMGSFHLIGLLIAHLLLGDMRPIRRVEVTPA